MPARFRVVTAGISNGGKPLHFFQISDILNSEKYKEAQRANCKIHHGRNKIPWPVDHS